MIVLDFGLEGMVAFAAPAGQQAVDTDGVDDGAGEDMGADFSALLQDDDREFRIDLLQADGGRKAGRTGVRRLDEALSCPGDVDRAGRQAGTNAADQR